MVYLACEVAKCNLTMHSYTELVGYIVLVLRLPYSMVGDTGLEPVASAMSTQCSNQLS